MIDLTEASIIPLTSTSSSILLEANEINAIRNFISEIFTTLPSDHHSDLAKEALGQIQDKLHNVDTSDNDNNNNNNNNDSGKYLETIMVNKRVLGEAYTIMQQYL